MSYVIGIDLGTSSVKVVLVDPDGNVAGEVFQSYPLFHEKSGWSEQVPEVWVEATLEALQSLMKNTAVPKTAVVGMSFSGQMHGLVLLDANGDVIRNAILWNDTRTTRQSEHIQEQLGHRLVDITRNRPLEGFTLPKLLWVKENEPGNFARAWKFLLPKDYLRYRLTGEVGMDFSDAAGTILLDVAAKEWSKEVLDAFALPISLCPPLLESGDMVGYLLPEVAEQAGLTDRVKVFAGGADNACGATGAGILSGGAALCSIGTSGVMLAFEENADVDYKGELHFFNHACPDAFYSMGVTLAAGYSLRWFRDAFAADSTYEELMESIRQSPVGAEGLLFTPYLVGERTPYADANIRGSFIGVHEGHRREHFVRAVVEGITFSLKDSLQILRRTGKTVDTIVSIGGGARNALWLQIQADIFDADVVTLTSEQGPALGAAMLAAVGCGWFDSLQDCAKVFVQRASVYHPEATAVGLYDELYETYKDMYASTRSINYRLAKFRDLK